MGFFQSLKDDLSEAVDELIGDEDALEDVAEDKETELSEGDLLSSADGFSLDDLMAVAAASEEKEEPADDLLAVAQALAEHAENGQEDSLSDIDLGQMLDALDAGMTDGAAKESVSFEEPADAEKTVDTGMEMDANDLMAQLLAEAEAANEGLQAQKDETTGEESAAETTAPEEEQQPADLLAMSEDLEAMAAMFGGDDAPAAGTADALPGDAAEAPVSEEALSADLPADLSSLLDSLDVTAEAEKELVFAEEAQPETAEAAAEPVFAEEAQPVIAEAAEEPVIAEKAQPEVAEVTEEPVIAEEAQPETAEAAAEPVIAEEAQPEVAEVTEEPVFAEEAQPEVAEVTEEPVTAEEAQPETAEEDEEDAAVAERVDSLINDGLLLISEETAVITEGMKVTGDIMAGSHMNVIGTVAGNIEIAGKLRASGVIDGNIVASELYADGAEINGNIHCKGSVKIGQSSVVIGNVKGSCAVIAGAIKGDIDVRGPVILDSSAIVLGNIRSQSVQISTGAVIEGMCSQVYATVNPAAFFDEFKRSGGRKKR